MELREALEIVFRTVRREAASGEHSLEEVLNKVEPVLQQVPSIKAKVEACANGELTYAELLIWLKENFDA